MQRQQECRAVGSMWHGMWWCDPERERARHGAKERALAHGGYVGLRAVVHTTLTPLSFVSRYGVV